MRRRGSRDRALTRPDSMRAEEQLVLLSAGTGARRRARRAQIERLAGEVDWSLLVGLLRARRLLAVLGPRLLDLAGDRANGEFALAVEEETASGCRRDALLALMSARIMAMLSDEGIRSSALKGPLLGEAIHGAPGRRQSGDIDLLVAAEQIEGAVEVVRRLGYRAPADHRSADGLPLLHFALAHERGELPPVELHWRIHWYERAFARERLLPSRAERLAGWRPAPADELAALLLFYARDGLMGLRLATDLSAWWDAYGDRMPANALEELIAAYPELRRAIVVGALAAEMVVGLPAEWIVAGAGEPSARERMALRMANPYPRSGTAQLHAEAGLVDWLVAPAGGQREFVRRQLLPPRGVRVDRARRSGGRRPASSAGHGTRVLGRYGLAVARVALARR
jgi:Uncharacterised nucleotidyltransferase